MNREALRGKYPILLLAIALAGCASFKTGAPPVLVGYVGSSTVALFLRDAESVYPGVRFSINTEPESEGGEEAILKGRTDLAGIARRPQPRTLQAGVVATLIGRDAIAVIVSTPNPVTNLSLTQLQAIFTGKVTNWKEVGGADLKLQPFITGANSATHQVFRSVVLQDQAYAGCQEVKPDSEIVEAVATTPGGIGQISFSFLKKAPTVRAVAVAEQVPSETNFDYPITRPLYLLWQEGNPAVEGLVNWAQSEEGQQVVMQNFVGIRVVGAVRAAPEKVKTGSLTVFTETYSVYDGGIYYYPHRPYEILTRHGTLLRRVPNHRGENDESVMVVELPPGVYLIRPETSQGDRPEFFVTIEAGKTTEVNIEELLRRQK